jgi:hypothetical protein
VTRRDDDTIARTRDNAQAGPSRPAPGRAADSLRRPLDALELDHAGERSHDASGGTHPQMPCPAGCVEAAEEARERAPSTAPGDGDTSSVHVFPQRDKYSARLEKSPDDLLFLAGLDHASEAWREDRARHHERVARLAELRDDASRADWHRARASGLRWRYRAACRCGLDTLHKLCGACGVVHATPKGCKRYTVCATCRAGRARARARRLADGMRAHAQTAEARFAAAQGWRWRWVTLTVPHGAGVVEDAARLPRAWSRLRRRIRQRLGARAAWLRYARSLELTSSDGGHAHLHLLVWAPWLSQAWLGVEWSRALRAEGGRVDERALVELVERERARRGEREASALVASVTDGRSRRAPVNVTWAVVDVRAIDTRDGDALAAYAAKGVALYASKGASVEGGAFELASELERALYARRTWQASPGLCRAPEPTCADCGARAWRGEIERAPVVVGAWWTGAMYTGPPRFT